MVCGCRRIGGKGLRKGEEVGGERFGVVEEKRQLGERLMAQFVHDPESSRGQNGDIKMLAATQRSGTAADKVSAFSVLVRDNPIANLRSLDALLGMVASNVGKRHALTGFEALKELFSSSLLPDRKLKTLLQRPVNQIPDTKDGYSLLLLWYWEECLKQRICRYERFVVALEEASRDMLPILKNKALKVYPLICFMNFSFLVYSCISLTFPPSSITMSFACIKTFTLLFITELLFSWTSYSA